MVRADSAYYSAAFYGPVAMTAPNETVLTSPVRRASARFPVTVRIDPKIAAAIAAIG